MNIISNISLYRLFKIYYNINFNYMTALLDLFNDFFIEQKQKIVKRFDPDQQYIYKFSRTSSNEPIVDIYNKDKHVAKLIYQIIGIYNIENSVWYWSWNCEMIEKDLVFASKKIKKFAKHIRENMNELNFAEAEEFYYYCSNGNFYTTQDNIDKLIKMTLYLNKAIWFLVKKDDEQINKIEYLMIKKIIQL